MPCSLAEVCPLFERKSFSIFMVEYLFTLKTEAAGTSEISTDFNQTTLIYIICDGIFHNQYRNKSL